MAYILERTTGLRVSEDVQVAGYDDRYWDIVHDLEPATLATTDGEQAPATMGATNDEPVPTDVRTGPAGS
jgi:hypothetical protein